MRNTSQDPEYEGLPYHEKKFHKTHFSKPANRNWVLAINDDGKVQETIKEWAIEFGWKILPKRHDNVTDKVEVQ